MKESLKKWIAEFLGTFILVVVGCGTAIQVGGGSSAVGILATSVAFGASIIFIAYSLGRISGGHVNPAVSLAVYLNGGLSLTDLIGYVTSQFLGAFAGSALLGTFFGGYAKTAANAAPIFHSEPNVFVALTVEIVLTFFFVLAVLGATSKKEDSSVAGIIIALALMGVHLVGTGITGTSVNPARGFSASVFAAIGGDVTSLTQCWIWIIGPLVGAVIAAFLWKLIANKQEAKEEKPSEE